MRQISRAPNGPPFSSQIAGMITIGRLPIFPDQRSIHEISTFLDEGFANKIKTRIGRSEN